MTLAAIKFRTEAELIFNHPIRNPMALSSTPKTLNKNGGDMSYIFLLFLCLSFFIEQSAAFAATYYVAKSGSDSLSCAQARSLASPKLTIIAGIGCLSGGDVLNIRAGTYEEYIEGGIPSGREGVETVVQAYQNEVVTIRPRTGGRGGDAVWFQPDQSYITLSGLIIDATNVTVQGVRFSERAHHIQIVNSDVKNASLSNCIGINDYNVHHLTFTNLKVHDCGSDHLHHGIYLRGTDHVVQHSDIYNITGYGVHIYSSKNDGTGYNDRHIIRNNLFHDNGARGILLGSGNGHVAYNNIVWSNRQNGIEIYGGTPQNNQIYNNTIYKNGGHCIRIASGSTDAIVKNNICWENGLNSVLDEGKGTAVSHTLTTDPKFMNPASFNFRVTAQSPAVDGGTPITIVGKDLFGTTRPKGLNFDIGAHEWASEDTSAPRSPVGLVIQ